MNNANFFDIVTLLVGLWAVIAGWRRGVILQLASLAGIILSLFLASRYAEEAGRLLHFSQEWVSPGGFIVVALVTLIAVALISRLLRKLFQFAGLGLIDILCGIAISLAKWLLLLSAIYSAFGALNHTLHLVKSESLVASRTFYPVCRVIDYVMPYVSRTLDSDNWKEWLPDGEAAPAPQSQEQTI